MPVDPPRTVAPGPQGGSDVTVACAGGSLAHSLSSAAPHWCMTRRVAQDFARNLDAIVAGEAPLPARPVGLFAMLWALVKIHHSPNLPAGLSRLSLARRT